MPSVVEAPESSRARALAGARPSAARVEADPRIRTRRDWLLRIRVVGLVIVGVLAAVARDDAPGALRPVLALTFASNAAATAFFHARARAGRAPAIAALLSLDAVLLTLTLAGHGGPTNPASVFFLVQCALAALLVPAREALVVLAATVGGYALLLFGPPPFGSASCHVDAAAYADHLRGMFVVNAFASAFLLAVVHRLRAALDRVEANLATEQRTRARHEKLASLSSLAATAAHELGTPLGTIRVVSKELERAAERLGDGALLEDARLVRTEVERCRALLDELGQRAGSAQGEAPAWVSFAAIADDLRALLGERGLHAAIRVEAPASATMFAPRRALVRGLANLVKNGVDAGGTSVDVTLVHAEGETRVVVDDDGAGMEDAVLAQIGEPFFTTKGPGLGLGLGVFLTADLATSLDGTLRYERRSPRGTRAIVAWPRPTPLTTEDR